MKERPIIMSVESVQAILNGTKTQTRRVIKPQPSAGIRNDVFVPGGLADGHGRAMRAPCSVGDHLWIRERHTYGDTDGESFVSVFYADDNTQSCQCNMDAAEEASLWIERREDDGDGGDNWRSPIYMPRWASRITLEVVDVRVQRLQDISESEAKAEGIRKNWIGDDCPPEYADEWMNYEEDEEGFPCLSAIESFSTLWNSINAKRGYPWESNPWVWVIEFRWVKPPSE